MEKIEERAEKLSVETLEKLPADRAENLDHCLICQKNKGLKILQPFQTLP